MNYQLHENESGSFQELIHGDEIDFGQLSYLTINPGYTRGEHYHKRKVEWFCCIKGSCSVELKTIDGRIICTRVLDGLTKDHISAYPGEVHSFTNILKSLPCELLIICSERYEINDPDTYKEEVNHESTNYTRHKTRDNTLIRSN